MTVKQGTTEGTDEKTDDTPKGEAEGSTDDPKDDAGSSDDGLQGLLDDEESSDHAKDDNDGKESLDVDAIVSLLEKRLGDRFDAIADRRVNAITKKMEKSAGSGSSDGKPDVPAGQATDTRGARLAFREYVNDEVKFIGSEERAFAMDLGAALIAQQAGAGTDDETLGRAVASDVATRVKALRGMYEKRTVEALRKRGALVKPEGAPAKGPDKVNSGSEFARGADLAKEMFGKTQT